MSPDVIDKIRKSKDYNIEEFSSPKNININAIKHEVGQSPLKHGNNTVRDPTPALVKRKTDGLKQIHIQINNDNLQ